MTKLTVKSEGAIVENTTNLIPIQKNELERILQLVGFSEIRFYSNFEKKPYTENQLQLVVVARK
jgi:hypothetical protein